MNSDAASLDRLRDIVEPAPVSWWPLAPGWWVLLTGLAILTGVLVFRSWRKWRANAYRRMALREMATADSLPEILLIIKRTALTAFPRIDVAPLWGDDWCRWLSETGEVEMSPSLRQAINTSVFKEPDISDSAEACNFAEKWITSHQALKQSSMDEH